MSPRRFTSAGLSSVIDLPSRCDDYVLLHRIAVGGMAEVFLAVEDGPGRRLCVIKRVRADYAEVAEFEEFFLTEGRVSLLCHHPNLPAAHRLGLVGGRAYLALEYVHGHGVLALARAALARQQPMSVAAAVAIGLGTARALEHLHGLTDVDGTPLRVVHRDVSPHNLIVSSAGVVKLLDLGVARAALQTHNTQVGVIKGKYAYMAPEQLVQTRPIDQRADLFALGAVLHELLVNRGLFLGLSDLDTCERVRAMPIPSPAALRHEVPAPVAEVVMIALARDPERRWASATALADALEDAARRSGVWPSSSDLAVEAVALCGPAPRPLLIGGALRWEGRPVSGRPHAPLAIDDAERGAPVAMAPDPSDASVVGVEEDELTEPVEEAASAAMRDPALAYFLHVGAVPRPIHDDDDGGDDDDA